MRFHSAVPIGAGATGRVMRVFDPERGHDVALKLLHAASPDLVERIRREAAAQARIEHPNVVRVYDSGSLDGVPFVSMQYVDGRPLDVAAAALPLRERVALVRTVADAVHAAHRLGLVHRDLKPANILVETLADGSHKPWVLDFGLVHDASADGLTGHGELLGTPGYLSPEQAAADRPIDARSDVFSLGVILYELATGHAPFAADTAAAAVARVLRHEPPSADRVDPAVPPALAAIIERCLEKEPARRYPGARALADALDAWLAGRLVRARPRGPVARGLRWIRADRLRTAVAIAALALPLAGASALLWLSIERANALAATRSFTVTALDVEREMWLAASWPDQDLARHRARLATRLGPLEQALAGSDATLRQVVLEPYTRALEALGEHDRLLARAAGVDPAGVEPAVAARFGRAYEREFLDRATAIATLPDAERRRAVRLALEQDWLRPALAWHRRALSTSDPIDQALARATLAHHGGDDERALALIDGLEQPAPGASLLAARLRLARVIAAADAGDPRALESTIAEAERAHRDLARILRSSPDVWAGLCQLATVRLRLSSRVGASAPDDRDPIAPCDALIASDGGSGRGQVLRAQALAAHARRTYMVGADAADTIDRLRAEVDGLDDPRAALALGETLLVASESRRRQGPADEAARLLAEAADRLAMALDRAPADPALLLGAAQASQLIAIHAPPASADPAFAEAVERLERAESVEPLLSTRLRLAEVLAWQASNRLYQLGDPDPPLARARDLLDAARARHPDDLRVLQRLALVHWVRGQALAYRGGHGDAELAEAESLYDAVLAADPSRTATAFNRASVQLARAREAMRAGRPVDALLARAAAGLPRLVEEEVAPDVAMLAATWRLLRHQSDPRGRGPDDRAAIHRRLRLAATGSPDRPAAAVQLVEFWVGEPPAPRAAGSLDEDLATIDAIVDDPATPEIVRLHRARLLATAARLAPGRHRARAIDEYARYADSPYLGRYRAEFSHLDPAAAGGP
jgi:serine/threonine-protein kinase